MPDLRDKRQAKLRARKHQHKSPGSPNTLPNNQTIEHERLPDDIARDISNDGVQYDPQANERRLNP